MENEYEYEEVEEVEGEDYESEEEPVEEEEYEEGEESGEEDEYESEEEDEEEVEAEPEEDIDPEVKKFLDAKLDDEMEDDDYHDETDDDPDDLDEDQLDDDYEEDESNKVFDDLVDIANGDDEEPEETIEVEADGTPTLQQIATSMRGTERYSEWFEQAREDGEQISDEFAGLVARARMGAKVLSENSLYNMEDMVTHINALHERIDPNAVLVPDQEDVEGWRELIGYPEDTDGYSSEIFEGTFLEDRSREDMKDLLDGALEHQFIPEQMSFLVGILDNEREAFLEEREEEEREYRLSNRMSLESFFGEEYEPIMKDVNKFFAKYGREFVDEFKGTKTMGSAALVKMIYNAMNDVSTPSKVSFNAFSKSLNSLTDAQILDLEAKTLQDKYYDKNYANSKDPRLRKAHRLAKARVRAVQTNIDQRGLQ